MVWPLLAVAAATAAANYMNNQQNQAANQKLADENRNRLNGVGLPDLPGETLDPNMLNYNQYTYGGDYDPTSSEYVREIDPTMIERSDAAKYGRDAQMEALQKFRSNISSGYDPEFAAKVNTANQSSQQAAQSRMASILQDAQRRGQLGTTGMLAAQMQGSSDAMSNGAMQSQQAAVEAYKNQLGQQVQASNMGRQLGQDEENYAAQNANIINSFNQRTSRSYQQYLDQVAADQNSAQMRNLNARQSLSNANVGLQNQQTKDQYGAAQNERDYQKGISQSNFNNQMSKATGQSVNNNQQMGMNNQNAQSNASMIQGLGSGIGGYFSAQDAAAGRQQDQLAADRRANYEQSGSWQMPENYKPYGS